MKRLVFSALVVMAACSSRHPEDNDPAQAHDPNVLGDGERIRDIGDPGKKRAGDTVNVTGTVVLFVDQYQEVKDDPKSRGTVYIQDVGSQKAYSGISLFAPTFVPANLRLAPGDVLDFSGKYVELGAIGSTVKFDTPEAPCPGCVLSQLERPAGKFRYEAAPPEPVKIDVLDLDDYAKGRRWLDMLVTVSDAQIYDEIFPSKSGRATAHITPKVKTAADLNDKTSATLSNEFFDIASVGVHAGYKCKELRGIVTWFFNYHLAPRSAADFVDCVKP